MTMKKLGLSLVAATMLASSASAALINVATVPTVSSELLKLQAVTINVASTIEFKCEMNKTNVATGNAAGVQVTIPGIASTSGNLAVYSLDSSGKAVAKVATFGSLVSSANQLVFDGVAGTSITQDINYVVASSTTALGAAPIPPVATDIVVAMPQNSGTLSAKIQVVSNDGVSVLDEGTGAIATATPQFSLTVSSPASKLIDAANGFLTFTSGTTDTIVQSWDQKALTYPATLTAIRTVINSDSNLSQGTIMTRSETNVGTAPALVATNDYNTTFADISAGTPGTADTETLTFTNVATAEIPVTNFTLSGVIDFTDGGANTYTNVSVADKLKAGAWKIYGYNAQIPNVRNNANLKTYINVTNSSSIAADVIFTILPDTDGVNASEAICSSNEGSINANTSRKFDVANILANSNCSQAVKDGSNMAMEIAVPTQPDSVYANAYTKNTQVGGNFIVLPVYNTSGMSY